MEAVLPCRGKTPAALALQGLKMHLLDFFFFSVAYLTKHCPPYHTTPYSCTLIYAIAISLHTKHQSVQCTKARGRRRCTLDRFLLPGPQLTLHPPANLQVCMASPSGTTGCRSIIHLAILVLRLRKYFACNTWQCMVTVPGRVS